LAQWFAKQPHAIDRVVCGPCKRHLQSAEATLALPATGSQGAEIIDELDEFDAFRLFGWFMQREDDPRSAEIRKMMMAQDPTQARALGKLLEQVTLEWARGEHVIPSMATWAQTRQRMETGIQKVTGSMKSSERVALFTSGGPVGVAIGMALELSDEKTMQMCWAVYNASFSRFLVNDGLFSLDSLNNLPHLENEALITRR
jgi:broad specificity phosphatase PhoE